MFKYHNSDKSSMKEPIFKRKIYDELLEWKNTRKGKTALLVEGARRVGKSTIVEHFAKNEYKSYLIIDFSNAGNDIIELFDNGFCGDKFFFKLYSITSKKLHEHDSVIIFDEVQSFPKARQMIKHLVADGRYDYIETGSLISLKKNVDNILIPSEEQTIVMHPMDFEEFRWAMGDDLTIPYAKDMFEKRIPLPDVIHRKIMENYREYMVVGGMPQVVAEYISSKDLAEMDRTKRDIIKLYSNDVNKIHSGSTNTEHVFNNIPSGLNKKKKTFSPGDIKKDTRTRDYLDCIEWLEKSRVVNICRSTVDPDITFLMYVDELSFKCYMADTGLLISMSTSGNSDNSIYRSLMFGKLSVNEGMFFENMVAQELTAKGYELIFSSFKTKKDDVNKKEIDFMIPNGNKIRPIEVKSSYSKAHVSLDDFIKKYRSKVKDPVVIHTKNLSVEDGILYIPIYMTMFL